MPTSRATPVALTGLAALAPLLPATTSSQSLRNLEKSCEGCGSISWHRLRSLDANEVSLRTPSLA